MTDRAFREEVLAGVVEIMRAAKAEGRDGWKEAQARGVPTSVIAEAFVVLDYEDVDAWFESIRRTVDAELITRAIATNSDAAA